MLYVHTLSPVFYIELLYNEQQANTCENLEKKECNVLFGLLITKENSLQLFNNYAWQ